MLHGQELYEDGVLTEDNIDIDSLFGSPIESAVAPTEEGESQKSSAPVQYSVLPNGELPEGNIDVDSLFGEPAKSAALPSGKVEKPPPKQSSVIATMKKKGFTMKTGYSFSFGSSTGWEESPWFWGERFQDKGTKKPNEPHTTTADLYYTYPGVIMTASLDFSYQIFNELKVTSAFSYSFPKFVFTVGNFYFDYTVKNKVFFRAGRFTYKWGVSSNYPFTDLLARFQAPSWTTAHTYNKTTNPSGDYFGSTAGKNDIYMARVDVPIGIGGIQAVMRLRDDFFNEQNKRNELIAYGGKYNLAFKWADINIGALYQPIIPLRGFLSVKSTVKDTEIYAETMASVRHRGWDYWTLSWNFGFYQDFFKRKLRINGEIYYNGEKDAFWTREADLERGNLEEENTPLIEGFNYMANIVYKPGWRSLNLGVKAAYAPVEDTGMVVPGVKFSPATGVTVSVAVPFAFGNRKGTYYRGMSSDYKTYGRPFSVVLGLTIEGSYSWGKYD
ncbi:MAG: hypothetical protein LBG05_05520 [Treponema sp.]|nr:hypothetical protein [Treponema sp.]